mmetsp:Transcript_26596/g.41617  ORF Transcript_26596/g.41617 Transcript_26596/m.41617 type:complete len:87 (-) Transcript_26596:106-366(-)
MMYTSKCKAKGWAGKWQEGAKGATGAEVRCLDCQYTHHQFGNPICPKYELRKAKDAGLREAWGQKGGSGAAAVQGQAEQLPPSTPE